MSEAEPVAPSQPKLLNFQIRVGARVHYTYFPTKAPHPVLHPAGEPHMMPEGGTVKITVSDPSVLEVLMDPHPHRGMATGWLVGLNPGSVEIQYHWVDGKGNAVAPDIQDFIDVVAPDQTAIYIFLQPEGM